MENQTPKTKTLVEHFSSITDPRVDRTKRHKLIDILVIAICACSLPKRRSHPRRSASKPDVK